MLKYLKEVVLGLISNPATAIPKDSWMPGQCNCNMCALTQTESVDIGHSYDRCIVETGRKVCTIMQDADWQNMSREEIEDLTNSADDGSHTGCSWSGVIWWVGNHSHQGWKDKMEKSPFLLHIIVKD